MSLFDDTGAGLDGLAQLRQLMASGRKPGMLVSLDIGDLDAAGLRQGGGALTCDSGGHATRARLVVRHA
jgi:hypothetical protein